MNYLRLSRKIKSGIVKGHLLAKEDEKGKDRHNGLCVCGEKERGSAREKREKDVESRVGVDEVGWVGIAVAKREWGEKNKPKLENHNNPSKGGLGEKVRGGKEGEGRRGRCEKGVWLGNEPGRGKRGGQPAPSPAVLGWRQGLKHGGLWGTSMLEKKEKGKGGARG